MSLHLVLYVTHCYEVVYCFRVITSDFEHGYIRKWHLDLFWHKTVLGLTNTE